MKYSIKYVETNSLKFDYQNPRLAEFNITSKTPENEIIKILWDSMGVEELVLSIKASGFFENEPLIAVVENDISYVLEGNRRLAAVKSILDNSIADFIGINKNLLFVDADVINSIRTLPVIFVDKRSDAWKFIGYKHINGPQKWGSYAKAQYIALIKNEFGIPLEEIASQLGDTHKTVKKLYQGLQVIDQGESARVFDRSDVNAPRLYFSHLYTGLSYEGFREFIGITDVQEENSNPVPKAKLKNLGELLKWIFGSKKEKLRPVIESQNPHLRMLEAVVKNTESLYALRDGEPLAYAYELSQPKSTTFEQSLLEAKRALQKAQSYQSEGFDGKDEAILRQAGTISKIADELYESMEKKWDQIRNADQGKKRRFIEE